MKTVALPPCSAQTTPAQSRIAKRGNVELKGAMSAEELTLTSAVLNQLDGNLAAKSRPRESQGAVLPLPQRA